MAIEKGAMFESSILVIAHPDDEILWFSSILEKVSEIVICYLDYPSSPALGVGRKRILSEYPLKNISCLDVCESESFNCADWKRPIETEYGLKLAGSSKINRQYMANYSKLQTLLRDKLKNYRNVYTHNPWGEYGHEDHVQVFRVVKSLQRDLNFKLWFNNYGGNRSATLMFNYITRLDTNYFTLPISTTLAKSITSIYIKHNCWTWYKDYAWFNEESFSRELGTMSENKKHGHTFPINLVKTDFPQPSLRTCLFSRYFP